LASALISEKGAPRALLRLWIDGDFELVACPILFAELETVLTRPKFRAYASVNEILAYVSLLKGTAAQYPDPEVVARLTPDPGDDYLVAFARSCRADFLISGDPHLCKLAKPKPPVLTPREFVTLLTS
jgi:uncharacterized protein